MKGLIVNLLILIPVFVLAFKELHRLLPIAKVFDFAVPECPQAPD